MSNTAGHEHLWNEACAEVDQVDPGWRWHELMERRPSLPVDEDVIQLSLAAARDLPAHYFLPESTCETSDFLGSLTVRSLRELSDTIIDVAALAKTLANARLGRSGPLKRSVMHNLPHYDWEQLRRLAMFLRVQAALSANEGRLDDCLLFARAILGVARAAREPPCFMSVLLVNAIRRLVADSILQAMQYGEPSEAALAQTQAAAQASIEAPFWCAMRSAVNGRCLKS